MLANWEFELGAEDVGSVSIEAFLERGLGFTYILDATDSAGDQVHNVGGGACDVTFSMKRTFVRVAGEGITLGEMNLAYDAFVGCALECAILCGSRIISERRNFSTNDEILEVSGASVG
mgnify:FL=1